MFARRAVVLPRLQQPLRPYAYRPFSTTELGNGVKMAFEYYEVEKGQAAQGAPIVFVHGLFGSKRNHRSMSKYGVPFYTMALHSFNNGVIECLHAT